MSEPNRCPECGSELSAGALAGLCPKCLLAAGLASRDEPNPSAGGSDAPTTPHSGSFAPPEPAALAAHFPQLEIIELLGHGGMGAVYKARQINLDRLVALKIIRPESADTPAFAERFNREAKMLARLSHPQIVAVYDFGEVSVADATAGRQPRPLYYFVMEYVDGPNLRGLMRTGELTPRQALAIVPQICEALQFAHDEGVVHRDIKPENILLDRRGRVKIADFGLAKLAASSPEDFTLTGTHQVMGTPRYMAPEQMEGSRAVDHRADIYSLGVVFYEMLTGEVPAGHFEPPSKKVEVDVRLDEVVLRSLAREPERRYQHASEVKSEVDWISQTPPPARTFGQHRESATDDREIASARQQIQFPVIGLLVCGILTLPPASRAVLSRYGDKLFSEAPEQILFWLAFFGPPLVTIAGAVKMLRLASYRWAVAAGLLVFISPAVLEHRQLWWFWSLCLLVGIWSLVVLSKPEVKRGFALSKQAAPRSPVPSIFRQFTSHRAGRLGLLVTAILAGYVGYKVFLPDLSESIWAVVLVLGLLGFLMDVLRHPGKIKGLHAALPLLAGVTALFVYLIAQPQPFLNWLYLVTNGTPGAHDATFLRVILGVVVAWLVWQMVQNRRKLASLGHVEQPSAEGPQRQHQQASEVKRPVEIPGSAKAECESLHNPAGHAKSSLPPGTGPRLLLVSLMMNFSALVMAGGLALLIVALVRESPQSGAFWGWMGGAFGCLFGGAGGLAGSWNTYRQWEGAPDLFSEPNRTWFDRALGGFTLIGILAVTAAMVLSLWLPWDPICYSLMLMGGIVVFQGGLFLVIRGLMRRAARQEQTAQRANAVDARVEPVSGDSETSKPRSTLGRAWDDWWVERDRWFTNGVQAVLCLVFIVCLIMYLSFQSSSDRVLNADGQWLRQTTVTIGMPNPWFDWETYPDARTPFRWKIDWFSTSTGIMLLGFVAWCVNWQVEKAKAKLSGKKLRWWHGSPSFAIAFWGVATLVAAMMGIAVAEVPQRLEQRAANKEPSPSERQTGRNDEDADVPPPAPGVHVIDRPWPQTWTLRPEGPALTDAFARYVLKLDPDQTDRVNQILQAAYAEYVAVEHQYVDRQKVDARHALFTVKPHPDAVAKLEDHLWSELDSVLDSDQQRTARLNLELDPQEAEPGRFLADLVKPGLFGWGKNGAEIEIRRVGAWYHWNVKTRGREYDTAMDHGEARQLPEWLGRLWKERGQE